MVDRPGRMNEKKLDRGLDFLTGIQTGTPEVTEKKNEAELEELSRFHTVLAKPLTIKKVATPKPLEEGKSALKLGTESLENGHTKKPRRGVLQPIVEKTGSFTAAAAVPQVLRCAEHQPTLPLRALTEKVTPARGANEKEIHRFECVTAEALFNEFAPLTNRYSQGAWPPEATFVDEQEMEADPAPLPFIGDGKAAEVCCGCRGGSPCDWLTLCCYVRICEGCARHVTNRRSSRCPRCREWVHKALPVKLTFVRTTH